MDAFACRFTSGVWCPVEAWRDSEFQPELRPASVAVHSSSGGDIRYRCGVCGSTFLVEHLRPPDDAGHRWPATVKERLMVEVAWRVACGGATADEAGRRVGADAATAQRWVTTVLERFRAEGRSLRVAHDHDSLARIQERRYQFLDLGGPAPGDADASWHWAACAAELLHRLLDTGVIDAAEHESSWNRVTRRDAVGSQRWSAEVELLRSLLEVTAEAQRLGLDRPGRDGQAGRR
jgi:transposase-like protein